MLIARSRQFPQFFASESEMNGESNSRGNEARTTGIKISTRAIIVFTSFSARSSIYAAANPSCSAADALESRLYRVRAALSPLLSSKRPVKARPREHLGGPAGVRRSVASHEPRESAKELSWRSASSQLAVECASRRGRTRSRVQREHAVTVPTIRRSRSLLRSVLHSRRAMN